MGGTTGSTGQYQATGTASLEIDVVRCPDGFDPDDLFGTCTDSGIEGVDVHVVSTDGALGVDQTQTTALAANPGPGRVTFTDLPAGDYNVSIALTPESGVRYYMYCGIAGGGEALPANPDDALDTVVTVPDGQPVACDLYVIPTETAAAQSTIDLFAFDCPAGALTEGGGRAFADFQAACTEVAPNVDFTLVTQDNGDTTQATDQGGRTQFAYPAGSPVRFFSGVPLEAEEWLFCSVNQGEASEVEIDDQGVSTFDNAGAEARICSWFLVEQPAATATVAATEAPDTGNEPEATATVAATEGPDTGDQVVEPAAGDSSINIGAFLCDSGAIADPDAADFAAFEAACGPEAPGVDFHLSTGETEDDQTTDETGAATFTFPSGEAVDFYALVPLEADEYLFCDTGSGTFDAIAMDDQGVAHFDNTEPAIFNCRWYLMAEPEATATVVPTDEPTATSTQEPTTAPTEGSDEGLTEEPPVQQDGELGEISFFASVCPQDYDPDTQGVDEEALSANCAEGVEDVSFTFGYPNGDTDIRLTDGQNPITFGDLQPGSYTLYSDVPLEAATEYVFCTADDGDRYEKDLSDRGVATFGDLQSEQISCAWYIVPTNLRGDETGGSLEIHLAQCPTDYAGDQLYDDCHKNGLDGYEFTLDGPDGQQTGTTQILQEEGPGVVTFSSLAPGDYTFNGGPPGDFGTIRLFCSTQPDNGEPEYAIEGALASLTLAENQHVLCDWYFIPENASGQTPTPTATTPPEPARAEILVTLYSCPPAASQNGTYGGASLDTFQNECTEKVNDVTFRIGDPDSAPLSAKTGSSGDGAVRFYDLLPGDLTMTPALPANLTSAAVFCTIDEGDPYQKALANGGTTFVDVDGESIACSWFAVEDRKETPQGPTGSITVREYLCEKDRSEIVDWDAECTPGSTGTAFTIANTASGATANGTPGADGVFVFAGLADGFYTLEQDTGNWCRAIADRVDSQSRVIVDGGGNTDVVLYQCNAVQGLPTTGSGPGGTITSDSHMLTDRRIMAIVLGLLALPLAWAGVVETRKRRRPPVTSLAEPARTPTVTSDGRIHMRFK
jgi:hypothetical protein